MNLILLSGFPGWTALVGLIFAIIAIVLTKTKDDKEDEI